MGEPKRPSLPQRVVAWSGVVVAALAGVPVAIATLLAVAAVTGSRGAAVVGAGLATLVCTGGLVRLAGRWITARGRSRTWLTGAVTTVTLAGVTVLFGAFLFAPAPPSTPVIQTDDVRYWELSTGSRIAYLHFPARGEIRPTPVVLVHGGPGAPGGPQDALAAELTAAGFPVYDYHQVGSGLSGRLADAGEYTVARHVADLEAIRRTVGADRLVLVGASWGGTLIAHYLAAHPDRVDRAVVSSPGELWAPAVSETERFTDAGRHDQRSAVSRHPQLLLAHVLMSVAGPRVARTLLPDEQLDGVFESLVGDLDMRPGCAVRPVRAPDEPRGFGFWANAATAFDAERAPDPRPTLRQATAPVLVLRGECDYLAWPITREYRNVLPNATLVGVGDAGHTIPTDRPRLYHALVRAFLLDQPLPQPAYLGTDSPW
ncbi:alpha/beta fold hydrolase [Plantactinospora sp. B5E13]|uniref:alpha/beta fold hydrolase n=1 Tax=unclassified Plantactinospora TaxID=2631981 RepID=UPI00325E0198